MKNRILHGTQSIRTQTNNGIIQVWKLINWYPMGFSKLMTEMPTPNSLFNASNIFGINRYTRSRLVY